MLCAACATPAEERVAGHREPILYGADDRLEVFEHPDAALRELARASLVALMPRTNVVRDAAEPRIEGEALADFYGLCPEQRFAAQPVAATCSGVLIDSDLVLTAAHCISDGRDAPSCVEQAFVFDYYYDAAGQLAALSDASIYGCAAVVVRERSAPGQRPRGDFAVVQLDREVSDDRRPVSLSTAELVPDQPLVTLGFPLGLPAKVDPAARAVDPRSDRGDVFSLRTDVFEGGSGGPVLDANGALVGVLGRGGADLRDTDAGCAVAAVVAEGEQPAFFEQATYAQRAIDALCAKGWRSARCEAAAGDAPPGCAVAHHPSGCRSALVLLAAFALAQRMRLRATRRTYS